MYNDNNHKFDSDWRTTLFLRTKKNCDGCLTWKNSTPYNQVIKINLNITNYPL